MCGIYASISHESPCEADPYIYDLIKRRGPDSQKCMTIEHKSGGNVNPTGHIEGNQLLESTYITCTSSVLSLRGEEITIQPLSDQGSIFCWNGEVWSFAGERIEGNDGTHVFNTLCAYLNDSTQLTGSIAQILAKYEGPYAFVYYNAVQQKFYLGRDFLGRRSLLYRYSTSSRLIISSVPDVDNDWLELESDGIYYVDLVRSSNNFVLERIDYQHYTQIGCTLGPFPLVLPKTAVDKLDITTEQLKSSVNSLESLLRYSLVKRVKSIPQREDASLSRTSKIAVLFSGGIDCTLLARLAHDIVNESDPIDLLNVAFENPRLHGPKTVDGTSPYEQCPDRKTSISTLSELKQTCPTRQWRLIKINVPYHEFKAHRDQIVSLIRPHDTEMDLSIAAALYFAARGSGILEDGNAYTTSARVLLSGLGADELFGGYSRHATAYSRNGLTGLEDELALDITRLGKRNLGRDDRVIAHWAKEARYPFLDEHVVKWALSAPTGEKCGFTQPHLLSVHGQTETIDPAKMILRHLAIKLNMPCVAREKKRAIQFGARTAKMETRNSRGTQKLTAIT